MSGQSRHVDFDENIETFLENKLEENKNVTIELNDILGIGGESMVVRRANSASDQAVKIIPHGDINAETEVILDNAEHRIKQSSFKVRYNRCLEYWRFISWQIFAIGIPVMMTPMFILTLFQYVAVWITRLGFVLKLKQYTVD